MSWKRYRDWGVFVPVIHYEIIEGESFCGTERAKINGTVLTRNKDEITCKICLKKFNSKKFLKENSKHNFEEDLFKV